MAKALFSLLLVAGLGVTGAATYKWYTGNCPFGLCHGESESAAVAPVKKSCCSSGACCSETANPEACTGECPTTAEAKKDGACCPDGLCCPDGPCCNKENKTEKKDAETPK